MANILGLRRRSGFISSHEVQEALSMLHLLDIVTDESTRFPSMSNLIALMESTQLTSYDAAYVDLALLATFDKAMLEAARQNRVPVVKL